MKAPLPWRIARAVLWLAIVGILGAVTLRTPVVSGTSALIVIAIFFACPIVVPAFAAR